MMPKTSAERENSSSDVCNIHDHHEHQHGESCGCKSVRHGDHVDYIHEGHFHRIHDKHVDECSGPDVDPGTVGESSHRQAG